MSTPGGHSCSTAPTAKALAFYLPQFHPIPENDAWWGAGFTEWLNVTRARPLYPGHYQPHVPGELGYYDLRLPEVRAAQADLARSHGISGFVYYHYWFQGKQLLQRPFDEVLASGEPDFPFALCWANEEWTRNWDGRSGTVLMPQEYSDDGRPRPHPVAVHRLRRRPLHPDRRPATDARLPARPPPGSPPHDGPVAGRGSACRIPGSVPVLGRRVRSPGSGARCGRLRRHGGLRAVRRTTPNRSGGVDAPPPDPRLPGGRRGAPRRATTSLEALPLRHGRMGQYGEAPAQRHDLRRGDARCLPEVAGADRGVRRRRPGRGELRLPPGVERVGRGQSPRARPALRQGLPRGHPIGPPAGRG